MVITKTSSSCARHSFILASLLSVTACLQRPDTPGQVTPVYNQQTGRLEQLIGDRHGDGKVDMRAYMSGTHLSLIEIDRNRDGHPDRWEYYGQAPPGEAKTLRVVLIRAEEANGSDSRVTRREFYVKGTLDHVEEDTNVDGRIDKWEQYENGALVRIDLDLSGRGVPDYRMTYRADGSLEATTIDSTSDERFKPSAPTAEAVSPTRGGGDE